MRLLSYDRGGARRLGAWVDRTVVDLPDAVGHPAFPSTMESLVARHGGTTLEAAQAALDQPEAIEEFVVPDARLLAPIIPTSVWRVQAGSNEPENDKAESTQDPLDREVEMACVLATRRAGAGPEGDSWSIFGFTLVDWWSEGFGPTILTADELARHDPALAIAVDGRPWMRVSIDAATLARTIRDLWQRETIQAGATLVFDAVARPYSRIHRGRVRPGALVDLEPDPAGSLRDTAGTP